MNINIISTNKFDKEFKLSLRRGKKKENLDKVINLLLDNINNVTHHKLHGQLEVTCLLSFLV
ncbi:hypothetical protein MPCS_01823 (plasmid) [Candidatus Megaera polyxenophila]|nr:hypothetical protein MPCS_01823 [Candidatus Megaera polyxenophila]